MTSELSLQQKDKLFIASGQTHAGLAAGIAEAMDLPLGKVEIQTHPDTEPYVRIDESVRGKHVIAIQSHGAIDGRSKGDSFLEHLSLIDAARLSKADIITAVAPNLIGSRGDRQAKPREAVPAHLYLRMLRLAGATSLVTVDVHSPATLGTFGGPVDNLTATQELLDALAGKIEGDKEQYVVISPDVGHAKEARSAAEKLGLGMIAMSKYRDPNDRTVIRREDKVDGVDGRICFMVDDMIDTAGTLTSAATTLKNSGALAIYAAATHGWFSDPGLERLQTPALDKVMVTDTLPTHTAQRELGDKLEVVPISPMIANALKQIVTGDSVSEMFGGQNYH